MRTKVWKAFWDYEKEEKWLNEMAAKGLAMTAYSMFRYTFDEDVPGAYTYRIELLEQGVSRPESVRYIHFLEENDVEHIDTYNSWIYLRKKATDGVFELYNDLDTRIKHYQRISKLWLTLGLCEGLLSLVIINSLISSLENEPWLWMASIVGSAFALAACVLFLGLWHRYDTKIKQLRCEREIYE